MKVGTGYYRTVFRHPGNDCGAFLTKEGSNYKNTICMIDQNLLPFEFRIFQSDSYIDTCEAIRTMRVRGAGAIGTAAGYAMSQAFMEAPDDDSRIEFITRAREEIKSTRPTARNLFYAVDRVYNSGATRNFNGLEACLMADEVAKQDVACCKAIGMHGSALIKDGMRIETHCNAGWLAFTDWGSALSPIYMAKREGKNVMVWIDETRPRGQGARLTAWELENEDVPHKIIADSAGAYLMSKGEVDMVIVGADRIAANGDVANKIGTLEKAISANHYGIPFCVAAPTTSIDLGCSSGKEIPIELRDEDEVLYQAGPTPNGEINLVRVSSPGSHAYNPAFDVTPAQLIKWIITEKGIIRPSQEDISEIVRNA